MNIADKFVEKTGSIIFSAQTGTFFRAFSAEELGDARGLCSTSRAGSDFRNTQELNSSIHQFLHPGV